MKDLSIVLPCYNEVDNIRPFLQEIMEVLEPTELDYEVVFADDGSSDGSFELLKELAQDNKRLVVVRFRRNHGQTAAFAAGFHYAQGRVIVTMDADRQNDPRDIPALLAKMEEGYDVVNGWRENRQDAFLMRKLPSYIANRLIARSTGVKLRDRGCSIRAFKAEVVDEMHLYGEMHRFIPEMVNFAGFSMAEVPVHHRARVAGTSKYGISRTFRVILDLMTILFLRRYSDRPMHLFGSLGLTSGLSGFLILLSLSLSKIWAGIIDGADGFRSVQIGERPLFQLGILLSIIGVQFLVMGLLAELLVRVYYETQNKTVYRVKELIGREESES